LDDEGSADSSVLREEISRGCRTSYSFSGSPKIGNISG